MISLQEIYGHLDELLSIGDFDDNCPNGLQIEGKQEVSKIGTAVSANLETIEAAASSGVDCLIVHHGVFWDGDSQRLIGGRKKKVETLLKTGISLLAYHLPLDAHRGLGNNWKAAADLGWQDLEPFGQLGKSFIGVKGTVPDIPVDDFTQTLETYYNHEGHTALGGPDTIRSAALVSGGAYRLLTQAAKEGIDCFITGNFDEPAWGWAFEEEVNFIAMGHSATETVGPKALAGYICERFHVQADFIDIFNPF